jgi:hypothetical protein
MHEFLAMMGNLANCSLFERYATLEPPLTVPR